VDGVRGLGVGDLDVLGFGPVAVKSSELFDNFWNSDWSIAASELPATVSAEESSKRFDKLLHKLQQSEGLASLPLEPQGWTEELNALRPQLYNGDSEVIYDRFGDEGLVRAMRDPLGQMLRSAFQEDHLYISRDAATYVAQAGLKLVGFDYISVDRYGSADFPAHHALLEAGVVIVEGLDLSEVEPGEYDMTCLPLRVAGGDGAPARVILRSRG